VSIHDKTAYPNFGETFTTGDRFIVTDAKDGGAIKTVHGEAQRGLFQIVSRNHPDKKVLYQALGEGLAEQARKAEPGDFPCVMELVAIPTGKGDNKIKRLILIDVAPRAFIDGDDGPALTVEDNLTAGDAVGASTEDALGF
jgi:hypothetical protein